MNFAKTHPTYSGVAILTSSDIDSKVRSIGADKEAYFMIQLNVPGVTILNFHALNNIPSTV